MASLLSQLCIGYPWDRVVSFAVGQFYRMEFNGELLQLDAFVVCDFCHDAGDRLFEAGTSVEAKGRLADGAFS